MHPFFRVLFHSSPFLTLMALVALAYGGGRFAFAWGKARTTLFKIATGLVYTLTILSWTIAGTAWISQWTPDDSLLVCFLIVLAILTAFAVGAIAEKAEGYGGRHRFLDSIVESQ